MANQNKVKKAENETVLNKCKQTAENMEGNAEKASQQFPQIPEDAAVPIAADAYSRNDDVSDFGIPVEGMIRRCRDAGHTVWAYARVSTKSQDLTRQIDRFTGLSIDMEHIIQDKATGTNFERDGFQKMMKLVQEGDVIIFTELDRFGRDFMENVLFAMRINVEKKVGIGFIENQGLNRMGEQSPLHALISMIMFLTQAYSSHDEHEKILSRTSQGRKIKAKAGAAFGRKPSGITDRFWELEGDILEGRISHNKARKELKVNYRTLKKWIRFAKKQRMKKAVEDRMGTLSKKVKIWCGKALSAGAAITTETVFEIKSLIEKFVANAGTLADSLSVWRRIPIVDEDGTIIRPKTYQRKETEMDAEVAELEAGIGRINAFADELVRIMESGEKSVLAAAELTEKEIIVKNEPKKQEIIVKNDADSSSTGKADDTDRIVNTERAGGFDDATRQDSKPAGRVSVLELFLAVAGSMKELKRKLAALNQKTVAEF